MLRDMKRIDPRFEHLVMSAEKAAEIIKDGDTVAFGVFGPAGGPKAVPAALAKAPTMFHFIGGASSSIDDLLHFNMISRTPYQQQPLTRKDIADGKIDFVEMHLAELTRQMRYMRTYPDVCVVESCLLAQAYIHPTTTIGSFYEFLELSKKIIVEVNSAQPLWLVDMASWGYSPDIPDIAKKIVAVVPTHVPDPPRDTTIKDAALGATIGENVIKFLEREVLLGRLGLSLKPLEFGVGTITDAVARSLAKGPFKGLEVKGEVLMDSILDLIDAGVLSKAQGTGLYLSDQGFKKLSDDPAYRSRIQMFPVTYTNSAATIRNNQTIAINGLISASLAGEGNSSYLNGSHYNGIGGSCEFAQNALISIFVLPSTAKSGSISTIVPRLEHTDHPGPNVDVLVTEWGFADLRGVSSSKRAILINEKCVHPKFRT
jgi:succinyl-CoA:acetate CoA-transferase